MYHPTGRVLTVLEILQFRPGITGAELAQRLEVDVRTVRRYIQKLQDVGIPVESLPGRYGGYQLRRGYKLPPLIFSEDEAASIVLGLLGMSRLAVDQSPAVITGAISKITRVLPEQAGDRLRALAELMILSEEENARYAGPDTLIQFSQSIQGQQSVRLTYTSEGGETTNRIVEPYGLVSRRNFWYLIAYCRLREDYRTFRLDRVNEYEVLNSVFRRDGTFDLDGYVKTHIERYSWGTSYTIHVQGEMDVVQRKMKGVASGFEQTPTGVVVTASTDSFAFEARFLAGIGSPFTVIDPPELSEAINELADTLKKSAFVHR